jgi:uncharacterized protein with HEPN domain
MRGAGARSVRVRLHDILRAIAGIRDTVGDLDFERYAAVWHAKHATERGIEIISEASRHIPKDLKETEPQIPWRQIAGIGNVLRHDYETISDHVIWDILVTHLDPLEDAARRLLEKVERDEKKD